MTMTKRETILRAIANADDVPTLTYLVDSVKGIERASMRDTLKSAVEDGLITRHRDEITNQPCYALTAAGKARVAAKTQSVSGDITTEVSAPESIVDGGEHVAEPRPVADTVVEQLPQDESLAVAGSDETREIHQPKYDPDIVCFDPEKRVVAAIEQKRRLTAEIIAAIDYPADSAISDLPDHIAQIKKERDDLKFILRCVEKHIEVQNSEGIIPAIDRMQSNIESVCSATRKFCTWVAAECLEDVFPLNLFECQQAIYDAFARRDARIAELESNMSLPLENARETISTAAVKESLTTQSADMVNHPPHYQGKVECIDAIESALGPDGFAAYCRGNAIKYAFRAGKKGPMALDIAKAGWYLNKVTA